MEKTIFVNLPVADVARSIAFYEAIGCTQNHHFSKEGEVASMTWSSAIHFMLLSRERFEGFIPEDRAVSDAKSTREALLCLDFESREAVDRVVEAAASAGGAIDGRPAQDHGFMYGRTFDDPDGHGFEAMWMDPAAVPGAEG